MGAFLKLLEDRCPGDDAHGGHGDKAIPLLERCEECRILYEAHVKELHEERAQCAKICEDIADAVMSWVATERLRDAAERILKRTD